MCIEEYVLVVWGHVGMLLDPALAKAWRGSGSVIYKHPVNDHVLGINVKLHGRSYVLSSVYLP